MKKPTLCAALLALTLPSWACENLSVDDAHIVQGPPGAATLAGYATIRNTGATDVTLTGASSPDFASAEFHHTMNMGGMMHMMHEASMTIPAKGQLVLAPNEMHLMLNGPKRTLKAGDTSQVSLQCGSASLPVSFAVKAP